MPPICFLDSTRSSYAIQTCLVTVFEVNSLNLLVLQVHYLTFAIIMLNLFVVKAFLCMIKFALYILDLREFVVVVLLQGFYILDVGLKFSCMVQFNIYELLF